MAENTSKSFKEGELSSTDQEGYSSESRRKRMRRSSLSSLPRSHLPQRVSSWKRHHASRIGIHFAKQYVKGLDGLQPHINKTLNNLTKEQTEYVNIVMEYLTFNFVLKDFVGFPEEIVQEIDKIIEKLSQDDLQILQEEEIKEEANTGLLEHLKEDDLPNMQREDVVSHVVKLLAYKARSEISKKAFKRVTPIIHVQKFIYHIKKFIDDIIRYNLVKKSRLGVPGGLLKQLFGKFAELCCLEVEFCNQANQSVWENLDGIEKVTSEPDLRLYKCGFNYEYTGEMISVTEVKPRDDDFDSNEPPKKKYKGSPRGSATDIYSSAENSDTIELDLRDSVLGQHAGELLLDLHREFINKEANYYEEDRKINMLGMIVNGTYVYLTVLDMTWKHYQKLRNNKILDDNDKATIYYTHARNILQERSRRVLIEEFLRLNNMELA
ncbi:uncharacterized protein LOC143079346 [Mytilus galloprovincialis]|uniref:uncharacterized protein LOC143079346 n=1 Tax=Mytilus galloprovincialis TaxID=29158 RepID=UPI003F7C1091